MSSQEGLDGTTDEYERLHALLQENSKRLDRLKEASMKDPRCSICHYPVAESRRRLCVVCCDCVVVDTDGSVTVVDFEKAEKMLMCGSCVMEDSPHAGHWTLPYLQVKISQSTKARVSRCLTEIQQNFNEPEWKSLFKTSGKYLSNIVEHVRDLARHGRHLTSWDEFEKLWDTIASLASRVHAHNHVIKMKIEEYGREMQKILSEMEALTPPDLDASLGFAPDRILKEEVFKEFSENKSTPSSENQPIIIKDRSDLKTWGFRIPTLEHNASPANSLSCEITKSKERYMESISASIANKMVNTPRSSLAPVNAAFECLNSTPKSGLLDAYTKAQESLHNGNTAPARIMASSNVQTAHGSPELTILNTTTAPTVETVTLDSQPAVSPVVCSTSYSAEQNTTAEYHTSTHSNSATAPQVAAALKSPEVEHPIPRRGTFPLRAKRASWRSSGRGTGRKNTVRKRSAAVVKDNTPEIIEVDEVVNEEPNGKEQTDTVPPEQGDLLPMKTARSEYKAVAVEVLQSSPDDKSDHVRLKIKRVCT
ncbi:hypothetical protein Q1695_014104 [Nippostrongylus brasiliensis]|nr:hypothetical protein Q1695_014104 [Nippostrongylus brasiliensis]